MVGFKEGTDGGGGWKVVDLTFKNGKEKKIKEKEKGREEAKNLPFK